MATTSVISPSASKEAGRKRRRSRLLSCFGPPAVLDSAAAETKTASTSTGERRRKQPPPKSWWSRFRAKKTVPVDVVILSASLARSEAVMAVADDVPEEEKKKKPEGNNLFRRFIKKKSQKDQDIRLNHHKHVQQPKIPIRSNGEDTVHHIESKCSARVEPAPLYQMHDQTRIGIRTSHPGSPVADHRATPAGRRLGRGKGGSDPISGLLVLTMTLAMLLLGGLICATACMCAWFCLVPQTRQTSMTHYATISNDDDGRDDVEVDVSSKQHKKMVVLQGLLQRDGRRPSRINNL